MLEKETSAHLLSTGNSMKKATGKTTIFKNSEGRKTGRTTIFKNREGR